MPAPFPPEATASASRRRLRREPAYNLWRWTAVLIHALRQALCPSPGLLALLDATRRAAEGDGTKPGRITPDELVVMHRVTADQRASDFKAHMPKPGQPGPMFTLPNQDGVDVSSAALVARGPLVMSFFRGRW